MNEIERAIPRPAGGDLPEEIQILVFEIMGMRFGADMEQIAEMSELSYAEDQGWSIQEFHQAVPLGGAEAVYRTPKVLSLKDAAGGKAILIDHAENIVRVALDSIRLFPPLLSEKRRSPAVWAAAFVAGDVVLLVDFFKLPVPTAVAGETG
ncbi:MAG: hypothetical protein HY580_00710 [Nitrospinae bacterium]|nr:hypothetical protein [Nitrospinota bacterium]